MKFFIILISALLFNFSAQASETCWKLSEADKNLPARVCIEDVSVTMGHTDLLLELKVNGEEVKLAGTYTYAGGAQATLLEGENYEGGCEERIAWSVDARFALSSFGRSDVNFDSVTGKTDIFMDGCHSDPISKSFEYIRE